MAEVYATDTFEQVYRSLDKSEKEWIQKVTKKLKVSITGKSLDFSWFREKKYLNKRLYFLIDEESDNVLFVAFGSKKRQQEIIGMIKDSKKELLKGLREL